MDLIVDGWGFAKWGDRRVPCAIGKAGLRADKREGDLATPIGRFLCRELFWRSDRLAKPVCRLPVQALSPDCGWCDDPADPLYNRLVELPYPAHAETLWRTDAVYDLIVPLGYNDDPVVPGRGSAIFLHVARDGWLPTEGCVALARNDLLAFLAAATTGSRVVTGEA